MTLVILKLVHFASIFVTLFSLGALGVFYFKGGAKTDPLRKTLSAVHGVALLAMIITGFGLMHGTGLVGIPAWIIVKLLCWVGLGGIVVFARKKPNELGTYSLLIASLCLIAIASVLIQFG